MRQYHRKDLEATINKLIIENGCQIVMKYATKETL